MSPGLPETIGQRPDAQPCEPEGVVASAPTARRSEGSPTAGSDAMGRSAVQPLEPRGGPIWHATAI